MPDNPTNPAITGERTYGPCGWALSRYENDPDICRGDSLGSGYRDCTDDIRDLAAHLREVLAENATLKVRPIPDGPGISAERIAELRRLHEAATPPPWLDDGGYRARRESDGECLYEGKHFEAHRSDNIELTVALRNALPALLAEIEAGRELRDKYRSVQAMLCDTREELARSQTAHGVSRIALETATAEIERRRADLEAANEELAGHAEERPKLLGMIARLEKTNGARCEECFTELTACGEMTEDGPADDCPQCKAEEHRDRLAAECERLKAELEAATRDDDEIVFPERVATGSYPAVMAGIIERPAFHYEPEPEEIAQQAELDALRESNRLLRAAVERIMESAKAHSHSTCLTDDRSTWNPDAHLEITITVADMWAMDAAIREQIKGETNAS